VAVQYYYAQSLDGYIAESDDGLRWLTRFDGETEIDASTATDGAYDQFFAEVGALAMGSRTYEIILTQGGWPYDDTPAWVFTRRTLPVPADADIRFADGAVGPVLAQMRAAAGERNVWIVGGGDLAMQLAADNLLDELHVTIVPVVLGDGIPAFSGRLESRLRLTATRTFDNGMAELRYRIDR